MIYNQEATMNKEKYLEILKNTIKYSMPQHEIKDILDELKEDNIIGYISDSEKHKEKAKRVEILIDKQDKSLNDILIEVLDKSNKLIKYVEKIFILNCNIKLNQSLIMI